MLERYGHGGDLETASSLYGRAPDEFVDFSSNMNPWGPPEGARAAMLRAWERIGAYPDPAARSLRRALAERHGVPMEAIWVGNGAAEAIDLALRAIAPRLAAVAAPGFAEYETAVAHAGGRLLDLALTPDDNFRVTPEAVRVAAAQGAEAIVLGHPNNPTGRTLDEDAAKAALESYANVVVDEAFLDFLPGPDQDRLTLVRLAAERPGLYVTRSMTKFYAIPALRLGYVVAHPDAIRRIRELAVPWSANGIALEVGAAVLADREFEAQTLAWLPPERAWLAEQLAALGLHVFPGEANFLLVRLPDSAGATAADVQAALGREGVLVRSCATFRGLDASYMRVAVKRREANERLLAALASYFAGQKESMRG